VCASGISAGQTVKGDVVVPPGGFCVINGTVNGNVYNQPGAFELVVENGGLVRGDVVGSHMNYLLVYPGGTVQGDVRAHDMTLLPGSQAFVAVQSATVGGDVKITNSDIVVVYQSQVRGDVTITDSGYFVLVGANIINGDFACQTNVLVSVALPSTVHGNATGQCANL
jgi:hypothetical protein